MWLLSLSAMFSSADNFAGFAITSDKDSRRHFRRRPFVSCASKATRLCLSTAWHLKAMAATCVSMHRCDCNRFPTRSDVHRLVLCSVWLTCLYLYCFLYIMNSNNNEMIHKLESAWWENLHTVTLLREVVLAVTQILQGGPKMAQFFVRLDFVKYWPILKLCTVRIWFVTCYH